MSEQRQEQTSDSNSQQGQIITLRVNDRRTIEIDLSKRESPTDIAERIVEAEEGLDRNAIPQLSKRIQAALDKSPPGSREGFSNAVSSAITTIRISNSDASDSGVDNSQEMEKPGEGNVSDVDSVENKIHEKNNADDSENVDTRNNAVAAAFADDENSEDVNENERKLRVNINLPQEQSSSPVNELSPSEEPHPSKTDLHDFPIRRPRHRRRRSWSSGARNKSTQDGTLTERLWVADRRNVVLRGGGSPRSPVKPLSTRPRFATEHSGLGRRFWEDVTSAESQEGSRMRAQAFTSGYADAATANRGEARAGARNKDSAQSLEKTQEDKPHGYFEPNSSTLESMWAFGKFQEESSPAHHQSYHNYSTVQETKGNEVEGPQTGTESGEQPLQDDNGSRNYSSLSSENIDHEDVPLSDGSPAARDLDLPYALSQEHDSSYWEGDLRPKTYPEYDDNVQGTYYETGYVSLESDRPARAESNLSAMDEESREHYYNQQMSRSTSRHHRRAIRCGSRSGSTAKKRQSRLLSRERNDKMPTVHSSDQPRGNDPHLTPMDQRRTPGSLDSGVRTGITTRSNEVAGSARMSPSELTMEKGAVRHSMKVTNDQASPRRRYISKQSIRLGERLYEKGKELVTHRKGLEKEKDRTFEEAYSVRPISAKSVQIGERLYVEGRDLQKQKEEVAAQTRAANDSKEDWSCPECSNWCNPDDTFCKHPCKFGAILWNTRDHRILRLPAEVEDSELERSRNTESEDNSMIQRALKEIRNRPDETDWVRVCGTKRPPKFSLSERIPSFKLKRFTDSIQRYGKMRKEREEAEEKRQEATIELESASCTFHPKLSEKTRKLAVHWREKGKQCDSVSKKNSSATSSDNLELVNRNEQNLFQRLYEEKPLRLQFSNIGANLPSKRITEAMRNQVAERLYQEGEKRQSTMRMCRNWNDKFDPSTGERLFHPKLSTSKKFERKKHGDNIYEHLYYEGRMHYQKLDERKHAEEEEASAQRSQSKVLPQSSSILQRMRERTTNHLFVLLHRTTTLSDEDKRLIEELEYNPAAVPIESATRFIGILSQMTAPPTEEEMELYVKENVSVEEAWVSVLADPLPSILQDTITEALKVRADKEEKKDELTLSYSEFHDALHKVLERLDGAQMLYSSWTKPPAYSVFRGSTMTWKKENDVSDQTYDEALFHPRTDQHSRELAKRTRENDNVYDRLYRNHMEHEENLRRIRESLEKQWKSEHPFQPHTNKGTPSYLKKPSRSQQDSDKVTRDVQEENSHELRRTGRVAQTDYQTHTSSATHRRNTSGGTDISQLSGFATITSSAEGDSKESGTGSASNSTEKGWTHPPEFLTDLSFDHLISSG